jgi:hypothetical protein
LGGVPSWGAKPAAGRFMEIAVNLLPAGPRLNLEFFKFRFLLEWGNGMYFLLCVI